MTELLPTEPTWARVDEMVRQYRRILASYPEAKSRLQNGGVPESRIYLLDRLAEISAKQIVYLQEKHGTFKAFEEAYERGEEFSAAAQEAYRANWLAHQNESRQEVKKALEEAMDRLQEQIAPGPGPIWTEFKATLPGFDVHFATEEDEEC
jgi:hypothetical protein